MKQQLRVLFFCVFIVMIGYGLGLPLLPYYIEKLATDAGETAHQAAFHVGAITGIFALAQFFYAPLFGRWSDRAGRRPFFLIGLAGYAISSMLIGFSSSLGMLYLTRVVGGILWCCTRAADRSRQLGAGRRPAFGRHAVCLAGSRSLPLKRISAHVCRSLYHAKNPTSR
jgi:MFS family permease